MNNKPHHLSVVKSPDDYDGVVPHNIEVEQQLLGILLINNQRYYDVFEYIDQGDFYDPVHARIYDAITKTIDAGRLADPKTLRAVFDADVGLQEVGGGQYLGELVAAVLTGINAKDYARTIQELSVRRKLLDFVGQVKMIACKMTAPPAGSDDLVVQAENLLFQIAERRTKDGVADMESAFADTMVRIEDAYKAGGKISGISSGLDRLDKMTSGFQKGGLYTLAGRASMGKTAAAVTIAGNAAQSGAKTMFMSLEMDRVQIMQRLIARMTGLSATKQLSNMSLDDFNLIQQKARQQITSWPLYVDDRSRLNISQIRGRAIRQHRRYGLDFLVIDYLGLIDPTDPRMNRNYQIEEITRGLKDLAKELQIPILLLAQVNRGVESRDDKRPTLADLRDSGAVEQDSDMVMFVYRHEYYVSRAEPQQNSGEHETKFFDRYAAWEEELSRSRGRGEIIIAKNRQGEIGTVPLKYEAWRCHFFEENNHGKT